MSWKQYITWAMLISLHLCGRSSGFDGFPLTNFSWYVEQDLHTPIRTLFAAMQERAHAAQVAPLQYVEEVRLYPENRYTPGSEGSIVLYEIWDGPIFGGPPAWIQDGPDGDGKYLVTIEGVFDTQWVMPESVVYREDLADYEITFTWNVTGYRSTIWHTANVTNNIGQYTVEYEGTNYTGETYVTRELMDAMWAKIKEVAPRYVYPGAETNFVDWFASSNALVMNITWTNTTAGDSNGVWATGPYVPTVNVPMALHRAGVDVPDLATNQWGIVTGGSNVLPPYDDSVMSTVGLARGWYSSNSAAWAVSVAAGEYFYATNVVPSPYNIDLVHYLTDTNSSRPQLLYALTNAAPTNLTVTLSGWCADRVITNTIIATNVVWDGVWPTAVLSCLVTTNEQWALIPVETTETISLGDYATNVWVVVTNATTTGTATNSEAWTLQWEVNRWSGINHQLYSEELNHMYYVLREMRWTMPFAHNGEFNNRRTIDIPPSKTNFFSGAGSFNQATLGGVSSFTSNYPFFSLAIDIPYNGLTPAVGEFDYDQVEDEVLWPYTAIPQHWPHGWDDTNDVPTTVIVSNRPPSFAGVMAEVDAIAKDNYDLGITTNVFSLPYAFSFRATGYGLDTKAAPYPHPTSPHWTPGLTPVAAFSSLYASATLAFDADTSYTTNLSATATGHIYLGDYSDRWQLAQLLCPDPDKGDYYLTYTPIGNGPGNCFSWRYPFLPLEYDAVEEEWGFRDAHHPFDGNGLLTDYREMMHIDAGSVGTNFSYTLSGCGTNYPTRAVNPVVNQELGGMIAAHVQMKGYQTTHMYLIFDWQFEHQ